MASLKDLVKKLYYNQVVRFLFVGGLNTIVGVGVTCIVYLCFDIPLFATKNIPLVPMLVGTLSGQIIGTIHSYFWNKYFTFNSNDKSQKEFWRFVLVYVVQYFANLGLTALFNLIVTIPFLVTVISLSLCMVLSYFGHKFFSFKNLNNKN